MVSLGSTSAKAARISPRTLSDSGVRASRVVSTRMVGNRQRMAEYAAALAVPNTSCENEVIKARRNLSSARPMLALPLEKEGSHRSRVHSPHRLELRIALAEHHLAAGIEHCQRRHSLGHRNPILGGNVHIFVVAADIDRDQHVVLFQQAAIGGVVKVD